VAVEDLTRSIKDGEVFGFLGPNGAGKTTTIRMLCAMIAPTRGTAYIDGMDVADPTVQLKVRQNIGLLPESPGLYESLSAMQNLNFFAKMYGVSTSEREGRIRALLQTLDIWDRRDDAVGGFSKGMKQKIAIARAMVHEPRYVFLDEPTSGLDPVAAMTVRNYLMDLKKEGRTIFINTHNLDDAERLCDRIGILRTRLLVVGTPDELADLYFGRGTTVQLREPIPDLAASLRNIPGVNEVVEDGAKLIILLDEPKRVNPKIMTEIVRMKGEIELVEDQHKGLEDIYLKIIGGSR
jgi:ABC-2 type transport system ATP-binding protein